MTCLRKSALQIGGLGVISVALISAGMSAQEGVPLDLKNPPKFGWHVNQRLVQSLSQNTQAGTTVGSAGGITDGTTTAVIAVCRKQASAASSLVVSARAEEVSPQLQPSKGSGTLLGPGQTMSSPGNTNVSNAPQPGMLSPQTGPVRHQSPGADRTPQPVAAKAPVPTQLCMNGIAAVDGQKSGIVFMPISGAEGTFVIQGCGFGKQPGEVYLSGLHHPSPASNVRGNILMFPDRLSLQIAQTGSPGGQREKGSLRQNWSDRQIVAFIDPGATGYFDTDNVSLVVKTASGQVYTAAGFRFFAAREQQNLTSIPTKAITPGSSYDTAGHATVVDILSPSAASLVLPGHTIAVIREDNSAAFHGGTDTLNLINSLAPGFQVIGVQQFHAALASAGCQSIPGGGRFSTNGTWNVTATGGGGYMISWQEQSCATQSTSGPNVSIGSVSVYALDITVIGPRGVSPLLTAGRLKLAN